MWTAALRRAVKLSPLRGFYRDPARVQSRAAAGGRTRAWVAWCERASGGAGGRICSYEVGLMCPTRRTPVVRGRTLRLPSPRARIPPLSCGLGLGRGPVGCRAAAGRLCVRPPVRRCAPAIRAGFARSAIRTGPLHGGRFSDIERKACGRKWQRRLFCGPRRRSGNRTTSALALRCSGADWAVAYNRQRCTPVEGVCCAVVAVHASWTFEHTGHSGTRFLCATNVCRRLTVHRRLLLTPAETELCRGCHNATNMFSFHV